jgi:hypothetical protein
LVVGVLLGSSVLGAALLNTWRLNRRVEQARAACREESHRQAQKPEWKDLKFELICDPDQPGFETVVEPDRPNAADIASSDKDLPGVQGELARAERQRDSWEGWHLWLAIAAVVTIGVSCVPWAWYFLLARVRELSQAISGK